MANAMRKMAEYLGLVPDAEVDYVEYEDVDPGYTAAVQAQSTPVAYAPETPAAPAAYVAPTPVVAAPVIHASTQPSDVYRIRTVHPRNFNDARAIGEEFRMGTPVIMNLQEMNDSDTRRVVDFAAGLVFALHGAIERISTSVYILSPANVDIGAAARAQVREDPFFNQS